MKRLPISLLFAPLCWHVYGLGKVGVYAFKWWPSFTLYLDDGHVAIDNNVAE
jgi:hypothetical protein